MSTAIRIVLVDTQHPGNVGASARAMRTMGLESLVLVRPRAHPDPDATARAAGGAGILARAQVVASVDEAIGDCGLVLAATARPRNANWRVLDAREAAGEAITAAASRPVAILFGGERNGLANDDIERCDALLRIPTAGDYGSMNLAQAVQVVCYELAMALRGAGHAAVAASDEPATADEMRALQAHVDALMRLAGFMHDGNASQLEARVRRLLARARPDAGEVRILRGFLAALERGIGRAG